MKYLFLVLVFFNFSFAHKINLFITNENNSLEIYSYFASGASCKKCNLIIKNEDKIILEDTLNDEGKYTYKTNFKNIEVIVDASGGHIASEKVQVTNIKHEDLKEHIKEENNQKYLKIFIVLGRKEFGRRAHSHLAT